MNGRELWHAITLEALFRAAIDNHNNPSRRGVRPSLDLRGVEADVAHVTVRRRFFERSARGKRVE